jgi:hypothetical protein
MERSVGVQTFQATRRPGSCDRHPTIVQCRVSLVCFPQRLSQRRVALQRSLESSDSSFALEPIDVPDEMRTGDVVCRRERTPLCVGRRLFRYRWVAKDAAHGDSFQRSRFPPDLPRDCATVNWLDIVRALV